MQRTEQKRVQRSMAPGGAQRSAAPAPAMRACVDTSDPTASLRESAIEEMLSAFPDNSDMYMYASGASASSKVSVMSSSELSYIVPDIADDILNYRPPSTAEMRKTKLSSVTTRSTGRTLKCCSVL